jgi:sec-independent protein translocase protein TatA
MPAPQVIAFWTPSGFELIVIMVVALLLFGKRLPEVARSLGKGVVEFKKGLKGVEDDLDQSSYQAPKQNSYNAEKPAQGSSPPPPAEPPASQ